jgi:hypothetical protein
MTREGDEHSHGRLTIMAAAEGPGNPRKYLDGQLFGIAAERTLRTRCSIVKPRMASYHLVKR